MTITDLTSIGEIAAVLPSSVRVFQRHDIDFCCGGKRTLRAACDERHLSFEALVEAIESSAVDLAETRDWTIAPLDELIDHIVAAYHTPLKEELPRLQAMAAKVARVHGAKAEYLRRIHEIVDLIATDLLEHMRKEELALFPAMRTLTSNEITNSGWLSAPISVMEHEHDHAGGLLAELRQLTEAYAPPQWACATFRALYHGLAELEASMHLHVHLENNVLFPRALNGSREG
jgi:regulator of cell morphogenesis and NO signaling